MNTIAIDCGASFLKGALFIDGVMERQLHRKAPRVHGEDDILCPIQIQTLLGEVRQVVDELSNGISQATLCISNEMHGFIIANQEGNPITDYISWQKEFGSLLIDNISSKQILESEEFRTDILNSGMPVRAGLPSANLLYLKRKSVLQGLNEEMYIYTLGDYLVRMLTGEQPYCHLTNAAATGLADLTKGNWNEKLICFVTDGNIHFPTIGNSVITSKIGNCLFRVMPSIGDQQAALLGAGLRDKSDISFNLGTGAQVSKLVENPKFSLDYQIRPFVNGTFIKSIPHLPSGRAMNVYIRFVQDILKQFGVGIEESEIWDKVLNSKEERTANSLVCDLSYFENPVTKNITGSIQNIGEYDLNFANLFYSMFDQMIDNFSWAANIVETNKASVSRLIFSGGVAKRIGYIRNGIAKQYVNSEVVIARENETLFGLLDYATMGM